MSEGAVPERSAPAAHPDLRGARHTRRRAICETRGLRIARLGRLAPCRAATRAVARRRHFP